MDAGPSHCLLFLLICCCEVFSKFFVSSFICEKKTWKNSRGRSHLAHLFPNAGAFGKKLHHPARHAAFLLVGRGRSNGVDSRRRHCRVIEIVLLGRRTVFFSGVGRRRRDGCLLFQWIRRGCRRYFGGFSSFGTWSFGSISFSFHGIIVVIVGRFSFFHFIVGLLLGVDPRTEPKRVLWRSHGHKGLSFFFCTTSRLLRAELRARGIGRRPIGASGTLVVVFIISSTLSTKTTAREQCVCVCTTTSSSRGT